MLDVAVSDSTDPWIGRVLLGRYRIVSLLGEGGMGKVYLAEQKMGAAVRKVAIKTLHPELSADPQLVARFNRESETVIELSHPNTIQFYDFGELEDRTLFIVMEFIHGESLAAILTRGSIDPPRTDRLLIQICGSLNEAHQRGIVHRDLKPENVLLTERGGQRDFVKVLDFGIAKRSEAEDPSKGKLTKQGMVLGTPPYMSPEQFSGEALDARSDIYSLGIMAYEMLTGRLPFEAKTPWEWATKHLTAQPTPLQLDARSGSFGDRRVAAVARALAKNRDERHHDVLEFLRDFTGFQDTQTAWTVATSGGMVPSSGASTPGGGSARGGYQSPPAGGAYSTPGGGFPPSGVAGISTPGGGFAPQQAQTPGGGFPATPNQQQPGHPYATPNAGAPMSWAGSANQDIVGGQGVHPASSGQGPSYEGFGDTDGLPKTRSSATKIFFIAFAIVLMLGGIGIGAFVLLIGFSDASGVTGQNGTTLADAGARIALADAGRQNTGVDSGLIPTSTGGTLTAPVPPPVVPTVIDAGTPEPARPTKTVRDPSRPTRVEPPPEKPPVDEPDPVPEEDPRGIVVLAQGESALAAKDFDGAVSALRTAAAILPRTNPRLRQLRQTLEMRGGIWVGTLLQQGRCGDAQAAFRSLRSVNAGSSARDQFSEDWCAVPGR